jgi:hypothetical protein
MAASPTNRSFPALKDLSSTTQSELQEYVTQPLSIWADAASGADASSHGDYLRGLGVRLTDFLNQSEALEVENYVSATDVSTPESHQAKLFSLTLGPQDAKFFCFMHRPTGNPDLVVMELELEDDHEVSRPLMTAHMSPLQSDTVLRAFPYPSSTISSTTAMINAFELLSQLNTTLSAVNDEQDFFMIVAQGVRHITNMSRVMIYQFDESFDGTVIEEVTAPKVPERYKGLKFPASDIPSQARALYALNQVNRRKFGPGLLGLCSSSPVHPRFDFCTAEMKKRLDLFVDLPATPRSLWT